MTINSLRRDITALLENHDPEGNIEVELAVRDDGIFGELVQVETDDADFLVVLGCEYKVFQMSTSEHYVILKEQNE